MAASENQNSDNNQNHERAKRDDHTVTHSDEKARASLRVGPYRLIEEIGSGGQGAVWLAEQTEPVRRRVAVKLLKADAKSKDNLARFESERQSLVMMDHPNIAKVFDVGYSDAHGPYFAMEYCDGLPITKYCDKQRLDIESRLKLFCNVCHAIQHAHQKGIIHRDIKPSNILVIEVDGKPVPKVIDFGLAKATRSELRLTDKSLCTEVGQLLGTYQYMSPEQAAMKPSAIDTRTDIYSLGVVLYELLVGTTPLESDSVKTKAFNEILTMIQDSEPPLPSRRISDSNELPQIVGSRNVSPSRLSQMLKGDLDWIVIKALAKEPDRRYETVAGFADDVQRFIDDEPIEARPPSFGYKVQKLVSKNKGLVYGTAATVILLLAATIVSIWFVIVLDQESTDKQRALDKADLETKKANVARNSLQKQLNEITRLNYSSRIRLASDRITESNYEVARQILDECEPERRNLEHHVLESLLSRFQFKVHTKGYPLCLAVSKDDSILVTGAHNGLVQVWKASDGSSANEFDTGLSSIRSVELSSDNRFLLVVGKLNESNGRAVVWNLATQRPVFRRDLPGDDSPQKFNGYACFVEDAKSVLILDPRCPKKEDPDRGITYPSGDPITNLEIWEIDHRRLRHKLSIKGYYNTRVRDLGEEIAISRVQFFDRGEKPAPLIRVYDLKTNSINDSIAGAAPWLVPKAICASRNLGEIFILSSKGFVLLQNPGSQNFLWAYSSEDAKRYYDPASSYDGFGTKDWHEKYPGQSLPANWTNRGWAKGNRKFAVENSMDFKFGFDDYGLARSKSGRLLAVNFSNRIHVFDYFGNPIETLVFGKDNVVSVAFSNNEESLYVAKLSGDVEKINLKTNEWLCNLRYSNLGGSPNSNDRSAILQDMHRSTGILTNRGLGPGYRLLPRHNNFLCIDPQNIFPPAIGFFKDSLLDPQGYGKYVPWSTLKKPRKGGVDGPFGGGGGTPLFVELGTEIAITNDLNSGRGLTIRDVDSGRIRHESGEYDHSGIAKILGQQGSPARLDKTGKRFASNGGFHEGKSTNQICISAIHNFEIEAVLTHENAVSIPKNCFSYDGRRVFTTTGTIAHIWDLETKAPVCSTEIGGHKQTSSFEPIGTFVIACGGFSPDSRQLVTGGSDNRAIVWDAETGDLLARLDGHRDSLMFASYTDDGSRMVTVSTDSVRIWDALSPGFEEILVLTSPQNKRVLDFEMLNGGHGFRILYSNGELQRFGKTQLLLTRFGNLQSPRAAFDFHRVVASVDEVKKLIGSLPENAEHMFENGNSSRTLKSKSTEEQVYELALQKDLREAMELLKQLENPSTPESALRLVGLKQFVRTIESVVNKSKVDASASPILPFLESLKKHKFNPHWRELETKDYLEKSGKTKEGSHEDIFLGLMKRYYLSRFVEYESRKYESNRKGQLLQQFHEKFSRSDKLKNWQAEQAKFQIEFQKKNANEPFARQTSYEPHTQFEFFLPRCLAMRGSYQQAKKILFAMEYSFLEGSSTFEPPFSEKGKAELSLQLAKTWAFLASTAKSKPEEESEFEIHCLRLLIKALSDRHFDAKHVINDVDLKRLKSNWIFAIVISEFFPNQLRKPFGNRCRAVSNGLVSCIRAGQFSTNRFSKVELKMVEEFLAAELCLHHIESSENSKYSVLLERRAICKLGLMSLGEFVFNAEELAMSSDQIEAKRSAPKSLSSFPASLLERSPRWRAFEEFLSNEHRLLLQHLHKVSLKPSIVCDFCEQLKTPDEFVRILRLFNRIRSTTKQKKQMLAKAKQIFESNRYKPNLNAEIWRLSQNIDSKQWYVITTGKLDDSILTDNPNFKLEHYLSETPWPTRMLGLREVSLRDYQKSDPKSEDLASNAASMNELELSQPVSRITMVEAARYCNWLTIQAGIPKSEQCYYFYKNAPDSFRLKPHANRLFGFRLPSQQHHVAENKSELEWMNHHEANQLEFVHEDQLQLNSPLPPKPKANRQKNKNGAIALPPGLTDQNKKSKGSSGIPQGGFSGWQPQIQPIPTVGLAKGGSSSYAISKSYRSATTGFRVQRQLIFELKPASPSSMLSNDEMVKELPPSFMQGLKTHDHIKLNWTKDLKWHLRIKHENMETIIELGEAHGLGTTRAVKDRVVFVDRKKQSVIEFDIATQQRKVIAPCKPDDRPQLSPDGKWLAYFDGDRRVVKELDGVVRVQFQETGLTKFKGAWSHNSRYFVFTQIWSPSPSTGARGVMVYDTQRRRIMNLTGQYAGDIWFSDDGKKIAIVDERSKLAKDEKRVAILDFVKNLKAIGW